MTKKSFFRKPGILRLLLSVLFISVVSSLHALEITRYVSATGTGTGERPDSPTSNLEAVLQMGWKVDHVIIYITDGIYDISGQGPDEKEYSNIGILGVTDFQTLEPIDNPEKYPVINCRSASFINCALARLKFGGSLDLSNTYFSYITARKNIYYLVSEGEALNIKGVNCAGFNFYLAYGTAELYLIDCLSSEGIKGLETENINVYATNCKFSGNSSTGAYIRNGNAKFHNCQFIGNKGGGAFIWTLNTRAFSTFNNCDFYDNTTDDRDLCAGLTVLGTGVKVYNSIFTDNEGTGKFAGQMVGAFRSSDGLFYIENCLFMNNAGAIVTKAYPGEETLKDEQIVNTAFFHNNTDLIAPNGFNIIRSHCATDKGSGIPELDREQGLIVVNPIVACGEDPNDTFLGVYCDPESDLYLINENSALINNGKFDENFYDRNDIFNALGGFDIGPVEYTGQLKPDYSKQPLVFSYNGESEKFYFVTASYKGKEYNFLAPIGEGVEKVESLPQNSIFTGLASDVPKKYGDSLLIWQNIDGTDFLLFARYSRSWAIQLAVPYSGAKPTIKKAPAKNTLVITTVDGEKYTYDY